jgi:hypothetical protein
MDIEKDKPTPMTWLSIIRWVSGPLFLLISIQFLSYGPITSAVFMFLAAVMSLPPTANMVWSKVNYSFSDTLQAVIVLVLVIVAGAALPFWGLPWELP